MRNTDAYLVCLHIKLEKFSAKQIENIITNTRPNIACYLNVSCSHNYSSYAMIFTFPKLPRFVCIFTAPLKSQKSQIRYGWPTLFLFLLN